VSVRRGDRVVERLGVKVGGGLEDGDHIRVFHRFPGVGHQPRSSARFSDDPSVVGDHQHGHADFPFDAAAIKARIWAWMVTFQRRRGLVGDQAAWAGRRVPWRSCARWRIPPESWCGYSSRALAGMGCHQVEHFDRRLPGARLVHSLVQQDRLHDLIAMVNTGFSEVIGSLKDHGDVVSADPLDLVLAFCSRSSPRRGSRPLMILPGGIGISWRMEEGGDALAAAGLADHPRVLPC